jgi:hypothetical protein
LAISQKKVETVFSLPAPLHEVLFGQLPIAICYLLLLHTHTGNVCILTCSNIRGGEDTLP